MGKDIFFLYITENGLKPYGTENSWTDPKKHSGYSCDETGDGESCAVKYIQNF